MAAGPSTPLLNGGFNEGPGNLRGWTVSDAALVTVNASHQAVIRESPVDNEVTLSQAFLLFPGAEKLSFTLNGFATDTVVQVGYTPDAFGVALLNPTNSASLVPTVDASTDSFFIQDIVPTGSTGEAASGVTVADGTIPGSFRISVDVKAQAGQGARLVFRLLGGSDGTQTNGTVILSDVLVEGTGGTFPPVADAGPDRSSGEGTSVALAGTFTEVVSVTGQAFHWRVVSTNGAVVFEAETQDASFVPADDGVFTATFSVSDANGSGSDSATLTITNVAPTLTLSGPAEATQGLPYTLNLNATDPGADTISQWVITWGDSTVDNVLGHPTTATHTYAVGPATRTITAQATDEDGTYDAGNSVVVTVKEVSATAIVLSGAVEVNEGAPYLLSLAASHPSADASTEWSIQWGDGSTSTATGRTATASHTYADGPTNVVISAEANFEGATHSADNTVAVLVRNVAPVLTLSGPADVTAGTLYTLSLGVADVGADAVTQWVVAWGDGITDTLTGHPATATHTYAEGPATRTITAQASDEDGTYDAANSVVVSVNAGSPTSIVLSGPAEVNEGVAYELTLTANHPSADASTQWTLHWGDGTTSTALGRAATATHTFVDGPTNVVISAETTFGGVTHPADNTVAVLVRNVAPVLTLSGPTEVTAGTHYTLSLGATDVGADTVAQWVVHWGDGITDNLTGHPASASHTYAEGPATRTITAQASDEDGTYDAANSVVVSVKAGSPTSIVLSGPAEVNEGAAYELTLTANHPSADASTQWTLQWGDGTTSTALGRTATATHTFVDGPTNVVISAEAVFGGVTHPADNTVAVLVRNVPPLLSLSGPSEIGPGVPYPLFLAASDPGADTIQRWNISWGDGVVDTVSGNPGQAVHTYTSAVANVVITAQAADEDGTYAAGNSVGVRVQESAAFAIRLAGASSVDEGASYALSMTTTDPTAEASTEWTVFWGDGSIQNVTGASPTATHVFADGPAAFNISALVTLRGVTRPTENSVSVAVANVAPTVNLQGPGAIEEGATYRLEIGAPSEPGADTVRVRVVHWGDGADETLASGGAITHVYTNGPRVLEIVVDLEDEDGRHPGAGRRTVEVLEEAQNVAIAGASRVSEGSEYAITLTASRPELIREWTLDWGDGNTTTTPGSATAATHRYPDGPSRHTISARITRARDSASLPVPTTVSVEVQNVLPRIPVVGDRHADEGSAYTVHLGAVEDPGTDTVTDYVVHWGDGVTEVFQQPGDYQHTYADGPMERTITVDLVDEDGTSYDADPLAGSGNVELRRVRGDFVLFWDGWGVLQESDKLGLPFRDVATGRGPFTLEASGTEKYYRVLRSLAVLVRNVAPRIELIGEREVDEGSEYRLELGSITDPGQDHVTGFVVHWGDGSTNRYASAGVVTHVYADGPTNQTVTVDLIDEDGDYADADIKGSATGLRLERRAGGLSADWNGWGVLQEAGDAGGPYEDLVRGVGPQLLDRAHSRGFYQLLRSHPVKVRNVAPRIPLVGNRVVPAGTPYRLLLVGVTDPGQDTVRDYIVRWGDGTIDHYASPGVVTHIYAPGSGLRLVEVDLVDEDGFFGDANALGEPKQLQMVRGTSGLQVEWNNEGLLEFSDEVQGPYRPLGGASSPYVVSGIEGRGFYRGLRAHPVWVTEPGRP
jgi:hypothetical protein